MYVYKITDSRTNKVYIGVDTKPKEKMSRWYEHLRNSKKPGRTTKFYTQLRKRPGDFNIEIVFESKSFGELFIKEIEFIKEYDSYYNGYNSTLGGDCFGVVVKSDEHYDELVKIFQERMREFNVIKWSNTSFEDRKNMIKHCHTSDSNKKRGRTIKKEWETMTLNAKDAKLKGLRDFIKENHEYQVEKAKRASDIAAKKNRRKVNIKNIITGEIHRFESVKEATNTLKCDVSYLRKLKRMGKNATMKWELLDE